VGRVWPHISNTQMSDVYVDSKPGLCKASKSSDHLGRDKLIRPGVGYLRGFDPSVIVSLGIIRIYPKMLPNVMGNLRITMAK
jgi:hypothetical protein